MKKKMISLMLAGALCASMPLTAFATDITDFDAVGSKDVTTEGTVNYADTTVYQVTLPTADCFNFTVDPQGILSSVDSTNYGEDKYPEGTAGQIIATEGTGAYINNKSSVPIKLMVEAYVEKDDTSGDPSSINLLAEGDVNVGIDNNMMLTLDITNSETIAGAADIKTETVNQDVMAITQNGKPTDPDKGSQISFALNGAMYEFAEDTTNGGYIYQYKEGDGDSVGIRLGGYVNTNADWSAFTGNSPEMIIVKTVFDFDKLSTDYEAAAFDERAHGVLADVPAEYFAGMGYADDGTATGPIAGTMDYSAGEGALRIPFNFGSGINELKVTAITMGGTAIAAADYKVINGEINFKSTEATVKAAIDAGIAAPDETGVPVDVVITTSDNAETTVTVNMHP